MPKNNQKTIRDNIELCGIGLHNGVEVNMKIKPSSQNSGLLAITYFQLQLYILLGFSTLSYNDSYFSDCIKGSLFYP